MESAASPVDVASRWRPFEDESEELVATKRLKDIHRHIRKRFRALDPPRDFDTELEAAEAAAVGTEAHDWWEDVVEVESEAVMRVLIPGPDRWQSESIDDFAGKRAGDLDGNLFLTDLEWAKIGVLPPAPDEDQGKAFTINQAPAYDYVYDVPRGLLPRSERLYL